MKRITSALCAVFASVATFALADGTIPRPDPSIAEFARGVKFTVAGYDAARPALTNFPVLVRLADNSPSGFHYTDMMYPGAGASNNERDLCFLAMDGTPLAYEIDTWNTSGTSLIWVTVPVVTNGAEFAMCYRCGDIGSGKAVFDGNAWTNYVGVWHMNESGSGSNRDIYDSTTNSLVGKTSYSATALADGVIGGAQGPFTDNNSTKSCRAIKVSLGNTGTAKRDLVDKIVPEFTVSFWYKIHTSASPRGYQWDHIIGRKTGDKAAGWGLQFDTLLDGGNGNAKSKGLPESTAWRITGNGDFGSNYADAWRPAVGVENSALGVWYKLDLVYKNDKYDLYYGGTNLVSSAALNAAVTCGTDSYLCIGGANGAVRSFWGYMDEVRIRKGAVSADWVAATYSNEVSAAFLASGEVESFGESSTPVAVFSVDDSGAAYAIFSGSVNSVGGGAESATAYLKLWPTATAEPAEWTTLATGLVDLDPVARTFTGLATRTPYSYKFKITNNLGTDSEVISGNFETAEISAPGTGGSVVFFGEEVIHTFKVGDETAEYTFTPPSYVSSVRALVVGGGGPGGYQRGGGGGAGGYIYNAALAVTGGETYTINVGTGGVASTSADAYGSNGGDSSISLDGITLAAAVGGGAGGNGGANASYYAGLGGGSGGGSATSNQEAGAGTTGQGCQGGKGFENNANFAGGGGGAGEDGKTPVQGGTKTVSAGGGGSGIACDITGVSATYAGGGGGGGAQSVAGSIYGTAGDGGEGGGGYGGQETNVDGSALAANGEDGLGGGGGGGSALAGYEKGGDGGDGIVIVRYAMQGDGSDVDEPIISLTGASYNAVDYTADVDFRVVWAGYGCQTADVVVAWGYAANNLYHTNLVASGAIGTGSGAFRLRNDNTFIYIQAVATNALGNVGVSSDILKIYVSENAQAEHEAVPGIGNVGLDYADGVYAVVTGIVTSVGTYVGETPQCAIRLRYGTSASNLSGVTASVEGEGEFSIAATNLQPVTTYYYKVEVEDSNHIMAESDVQSFTTKGGSAIASISGSPSQRTITVNGAMGVIGASTTHLFLKVADGEWTPLATTFNRTSQGLAFSTSFIAPTWSGVSWQIMSSNECLTVTGEPSGTFWVDVKEGATTPKDEATYIWQSVDGDWNGSWSDPAHWSCNKADNPGYPNSDTCYAKFTNCTLDNPVVVTVDGKYRVKWFDNNGTEATDVTFLGLGRSASSITAANVPTYDNNAFAKMKSNSAVRFTDMTINVTGNNHWQFMRETPAVTNLTAVFSGVNLTGNVNWLCMATPYSYLGIENASTVTVKKVALGGTNTVFKVDNSLVTITADGLYTPADSVGDGLTVRFLGAAPRIRVTGSSNNGYCGPYHNSATNVTFAFSVPVGGYEYPPIEMPTSQRKFGQENTTGGGKAKYMLAVEPDSPALSDPRSLTDMVVVQTAAGIATNHMYEVIGTVPEHDGVPYGEFKWGLNGSALADGADVTTARQILLDLTGVEPYVALTIPSPLPENVSLVSVTTNGFAVEEAEGVYTVLDGATVAITFAPAEDYALVGSETVEVVMDGDTTLSSDLIPTAVSIRPVTLTIPELPANVSIASVTTNGIAIAPAEGVYTVVNGASVTVTFEAASGYVLSGAPASATVAMDGDVTFPSASVPTATTPQAAISINEIMASNPSPDKGGNATEKGIAELDWIEIRNTSSESIDITGWYLSDSAKKPTKAQILGSCVVPANGYKLIWLDKTYTNATDWAAGEAHAVLKLSSSGDLIQLADATGKVVPGQSINFKDKPQIKGYSYGPGTVTYGPNAGMGPYVYMKTATPGAENVTEGWGDFTPTVYFSVPHGWKTESFNLELVCSNAPSADIYYTLDGTSPTTASTLYSGPIAITGTTIVRAAVPVVGSILQRDTSATYLFLDDILAQGRTTTAPASATGFPNSGAVNSQALSYGLDQSVVTGADRDRLLRGFTNSISTISVVIDPANLFNSATGIYVNPRGEGAEWERQTMLEIFDPKGAAADVTIPAGIRIRGGNSRNTSHPKHSLRFFFRSEYGQSSLDAKLFLGESEIGEYDKMDLRTSQNISWANENSTLDTFVTEVFSRDSQRDMGQPYTRSRYYNLFINGQYWGLYQTQERGDEHFGEAYLGGDSLQYDLIKTASTFVNNKLTYMIECNEGTWDAWTNLFNIAVNEGFAGEHADNYYRVLGLNPDGTRNPAYPILVNQESLMTYMLVSHYVVDKDGPTSPFSSLDKGHANNFYALRNRNDAGDISGFVFLRHDAELSMGIDGNYTVATRNPTFWGTEAQTDPSVPVGGSTDPSGLGKAKFRTVPYFTPAELHYLLMQNPDYRRAYADAFYRHFLRPGGAMTIEKGTERYTGRMAEIDDAIVCEQARWAQGGKSRTTWLTACGTCVTFITNRVSNMKSQYVAAQWYPSIDAPSATNALGQVFADGDKIEPEDTIHFSGTESGTIYYTTNGLDPRAVDGTVAEGAIAYDPATGAALPETGALVKARVLTGGGEWSALEEVEIDVNLPSDQKLGIRIAAIMSVPKNDPDGEFIILTNILDRAVSLQGLTVKAEKSTKTPTTLFTITDDIELAAGASIKLKRADYWSSNDDLKLKNNDIIVVIRDLNDKLVQTAIVKADTWFLTTKLDDKGKPIGACKGLGSYFIALEFGEEVVREDQWKASPLPPKPTVFMAF